MACFGGRRDNLGRPMRIRAGRCRYSDGEASYPVGVLALLARDYSCFSGMPLVWHWDGCRSANLADLVGGPVQSSESTSSVESIS